VENPDESRWGWKSDYAVWNDAASWAVVGQYLWIPLSDFGLSGQTNLSFVITGVTCDCMPGDANGDKTINIGDAVYIINYIFKGGAAPTPYTICSGDANVHCEASIADAVYLITYIFKGGPPPGDCLTWLLTCGPPLRK
jgi:hypothetical protein